MASKTMTHLIILMSLILLSCSPVSAKGNEVLAVLSFDNPVYREILKGFTAASGLTVSEYVMAADEKELSAKITSAKPYGVIFAIGSKAFSAAKKTAIPVVFSMVFEEISDTGAGVTLILPADIKVEKIKEFLPKVKKVGVVYSDESAASFNHFLAAAQAGGLSVAGKKIDGAEGFSDAFESMVSSIDCYMMIPDTKIYTSLTIKSLFTSGMDKKIPVVGISSIYTKAGAYFSIDCDYADMGSQAGAIAADVAAGKKGKMVYPRKTTISINSSIAKMLGLEDLSAKAAQVF